MNFGCAGQRRDDFWPVVKQHEKLQKETLKSKVLCLLTARTGVGRPMAEH
ncbi:hypothetical protein F2Q69_00007195 [Brassica cretica]|uniref:Uncharacterized protein n=1 Tax=Brassica cretica TaxID=69181 RepID=A0A8S9PGX1_BRACR|nr:hypothetical protein F2Q69_00007195 [Brassica cretica]